MTTHSTVSGYFFGVILGAKFKTKESQSIGPTDAGFGDDVSIFFITNNYLLK